MNSVFTETGNTSTRKRMLFLYRGWNSGTNQALLQTWQEETPELAILPHDVSPFSHANLITRLKFLPLFLRRNRFSALWKGRGAFTDEIKRTRWCMDQIATRIAHIQQMETFDFAFCVGTVIPLRHFHKPYFIYTDLAIRSNLYYPGGEDQLRLWKECLPCEEETLRSATMVFTMSDHVSRSLMEHYRLPASQIMKVNGGCNVPFSPSSDPQRYHRQNILFVGVDWERKGGPELLEAFRQVRSRNPQATLTIVGCSPHIAGPGVEIVGSVPQNKIPEFLSKATLFCMPSKREPFGIAYLEAMRAELPVIASDLGAAPDFVRNDVTGYTVDSTDITAIAQRIEELIRDPDKCRRLGLAGRDLVNTEYTWQKTQQQMWSAIRRIL